MLKSNVSLSVYFTFIMLAVVVHMGLKTEQQVRLPNE